MKLELKNVKVMKSLSEETTAYTATLYADGKPVAECSNHGQGGPDSYHPMPRLSGADERFKEVEAALGGSSAMEDTVGNLLTEWIDADELKKFRARSAKKGFPFTVRVRVLDYTIAACKGYDGTEYPAQDVFAWEMTSFKSESAALKYVETGAAEKYKDTFRFAEVVK